MSDILNTLEKESISGGNFSIITLSKIKVAKINVSLKVLFLTNFKIQKFSSS